MFWCQTDPRASSQLMEQRIFRNGSSEFVRCFDACIHSSMRIMPQVTRRSITLRRRINPLSNSMRICWKMLLQGKQLVFLIGKIASSDAIPTWYQCPSAFWCDQMRCGYFICHSLHLSVYICVFNNSSGF